MSSDDDSFYEFVIDQLAELRGLRSKAMFGGFGLYRGDVFFGILSKSGLYFKVSAATRTEYQSRGMAPFCPNGKQTLTSFYEVPIEILEQPEDLVRWAQEAIMAAIAASSVQATRRKQGRPRRTRNAPRS